MMETMIPPQVGMRLWTLIKRERPNKKNMREKERRDSATIPFTTLVLQSSTMIFMIESLLLRESWIRGCPDGRTQTFGRTPGL